MLMKLTPVEIDPLSKNIYNFFCGFRVRRGSKFKGKNTLELKS